MLLLKIFTLIVLLLIFWQDVKSHSVQWFLFPLLSILLVCTSLSGSSLRLLWQNTLINWGFICIQLFILTLYFSVKNKRWINITRNLLGPGDIVFLFSIACYLSLLNFLFFYITSLLLILLFWLIISIGINHKNNPIPLAGLQSIIFAVFLTGCWCCGFVRLTDDVWLLNIINK